MDTTIKLDAVLDLVRVHQEELAIEIDSSAHGTFTRAVLWQEYKHVSDLYDKIRRAAND